MLTTLLGVAVISGAFVLGGCTSAVHARPEDGALAWQLDSSHVVAPDSRQLHLIVQVLRAANLTADITTAVDYRPEEIAVSVVRPGYAISVHWWEFVELPVELTEPLGNRRIVSWDEQPPFNTEMWLEYRAVSLRQLALSGR